MKPNKPVEPKPLTRRGSPATFNKKEDRKMRLLVIIAAVLFAGCSRTVETEQAEEKKAQAPAESTARQVIDGMTGRTAVKAGRKAKATLEKVGAQEKQDLDEVLGE